MRRSSGVNSSGSELLSGASILSVRNPLSSARPRSRFRSTVLPTPRSPSKISPLAGRPARTRSMSMETSVRRAIATGELRRLEARPWDERIASTVHWVNLT